MRFALIQQHAGEDKAANVERGLVALKRAAENGANCACFAELAFERFHPQCRPTGDPASLAETIPGPTTDVFARAAAAHSMVVVINLYERDGDRCYDSSPVIDADGTLLGRTRMVHITEYEAFHEQDYYAPGDTGVPIYDTAAGRLGVAICYDRHYPEYMRALGVQEPEVVIVPQAGAVDEWPDGLYEAEMRVAAFQNGYHVALCNRVGREDKLTFAGESFVTAPDGTVIARAPRGEDHILYADLVPAAAADSHARKLFLRDRRPDLYADWINP